MKKWVGIVFAAACLPGLALAQGPAFEVAAIRLSPSMDSVGAQILSGKLHVGMRIEGQRVDIGETTLAGLIQLAYKVKPYQVSGPSWISEQRWEVQATMPAGTSREQVPQMLQALLADRFKMTIHHETREHAIYALVVGKDGPKMTPAAAPVDAADAGAANADVAKNAFAVDTPNGKMTVTADGKGGAVASSPGTGKIRVSMGPDRTMRMETERMTMPALADQLSPMLDKPVIDMTGLTGSYQVTLELSMEDLMAVARGQGMPIPGGMAGMLGRGGGGGAGSASGTGAGPAAASDPSGGTVFQNVQKLGLRLDSRKVPVDLIVVDHLEKTPTEN